MPAATRSLTVTRGAFARDCAERTHRAVPGSFAAYSSTASASLLPSSKVITASSNLSPSALSPAAASAGQILVQTQD
eukprot:2662678-Pleurochrysis_carterae.AAC.1